MKAHEINWSKLISVQNESLNLNDIEARENNLYGLNVLRCGQNRKIEIKTKNGSQWVIDCLSNSPFSLNVRPEVVDSSIDAIRNFGALHSSVASARASTGMVYEITQKLSQMKTGDAESRLYPTTLSANIAVAAGLASKKLDATAIVHPNVHATVQFAIAGAFDPKRIIKSKNTAAVASAFAKTTKRPVVIIEDGLYSMGNFADFKGLGNFLDENKNGWVWFDDAHSVGMRGTNGRGEAMETMEKYTNRTIITGSLGKAFGAAGGFMSAPKSFTQNMLSVSVSDRFSCNLDVSAQGAILGAMRLLADINEYEHLQHQLKIRLDRFDAALDQIGIVTEQRETPIAYRVIPFSGPQEAIDGAAILLNNYGFVTTPVYYPTIARGKGAIRISLSVGHQIKDIDRLVTALHGVLSGEVLSVGNRSTYTEAKECI
ncbi:aminotransferase class I/II-fold pyridoxal phosphate-dependent enzyme [uncultured Shewanella sp.]|uniref:aminotransferase class I/II-fold pyridoxal phosphate-dependent enzyme n=1 Tax=uncultured Shewanella sp. TaxID=173975 RepID=UPI00262434EB|nr:aminotransferase class I/II-fold pyridoxal phosphate-dependent enzyme [uncultured Shewanella sp.]